MPSAAPTAGSAPLILQGTVRLSDSNQRRTTGKFAGWMAANESVLRRKFGADLFQGSLNVNVPDSSSLQTDLDAGRPKPSFVIPHAELVMMAPYLGDGQAWAALLKGAKFPTAIHCWIFRRIGSRVPPSVIELIAREPLCKPYGLLNDDPVSIELPAP